MQWAEVSITIDQAGVEAAANIFHELGAGGVVIEEPELFMSYGAQGKWEYEDLPIAGPETGATVRGYLPVDSSLPERLEQIQARVNGILEALPEVEGRIEFRQLDDEDWAGAWKKYYQTIKLGQRLVIKPAWEQYSPAAQEVVIEIDPGMAFGTGTHPSTIMCLLALEEYITGGERVFDIGTGSGILAIAAAKLGAREVVGIDCDPVAVKSATANVALNGVADRIFIRLGNLLDEVEGQADLVVANISTNVIKGLADQLGNHLVPGGRAVLGGIISHRLLEVREALGEAGLMITGSRIEDDWITLVVEKE